MHINGMGVSHPHCHPDCKQPLCDTAQLVTAKPTRWTTPSACVSRCNVYDALHPTRRYGCTLHARCVTGREREPGFDGKVSWGKRALTTDTDETVMSRGAVGGCVALGPPLAVTTRL
jgi:hypothetical protein